MLHAQHELVRVRTDEGPCMYADIHRQRVRKDLRVTRSTSCIGQFNDFFYCMHAARVH